MEKSFLIKYKPKRIEDFKFSKMMENTLKMFIDIDDLNLLLYGSQNSGKTMLLECIARTYYGLEPNSPLPENNIIYINNLKEQGIQFYRNEMKTFCQSHSIIRGKKKLIIIDDLDNVNEPSQQVFRNYIDKYKNNVHFLMVCSSIQKVIESIQSRTHVIQVKSLSRENIKWYINSICENEKISINENVKEYLLSISNDSIRTAINHLEKLYILDAPITLELVKNVCSNISCQHMDEYLEGIMNNDLLKSIRIFYQLYESGYSVIDILDYFFFYIKTNPKIDETLKYKLIPYLCKYITIFHNLHEDVIELALFTNSIYKDVFLSTNQ